MKELLAMLLVGLNQKESNKQMLYSLIKKSQLENLITFEDFDKIYEWVHVKENYLVDVPLYDLNIINKPLVDFEYDIKGLIIKGNNLLNQVQIDINEEDNKINLIAKSPADWSAIMLKTNGTYTFNAQIIGDAYPRQAGHNWCLTYGINFTTGKEVLPIKREMFCDSGEYWIKNDSTKRIFSNKLDLILSRQNIEKTQGKDFTKLYNYKIILIF